MQYTIAYNDTCIILFLEAKLCLYIDTWYVSADHWNYKGVISPAVSWAGKHIFRHIMHASTSILYVGIAITLPLSHFHIVIFGPQQVTFLKKILWYHNFSSFCLPWIWHHIICFTPINLACLLISWPSPIYTIWHSKYYEYNRLTRHLASSSMPISIFTLDAEGTFQQHTFTALHQITYYSPGFRIKI